MHPVGVSANLLALYVQALSKASWDMKRTSRLILRWFLFIGIAVCLTPATWAQENSLDKNLKRVLADPAAVKQAMEGAKKFNFFCANCHGQTGISVKNDVPNLAGQNPSYLITQIDNFARGKRRYQFMQDSMRMLTDTDKVNLTVYYALNSVTPAGKLTSTAGKALFAERCAICHQAEAHGTEIIPRLARQHELYLEVSIKRYRDRSGERIYEPMSRMTAGLKDAEITALATYLSSLP
jgi:cytochrome c553